MQNEFELRVSASGRVWVHSRYAAAFDALGLNKFASAMTFLGGEMVGKNRKRDVVRFTSGGETFYFKRFRLPPAKDGLADAIRLRRPRTHAAREAEVIRALGEAGLGCPEIAAWGEEAGIGLRRQSFLITAALTGYDDLWRIVTQRSDLSAATAPRRVFFQSLARDVRRLHDGGITHPDLYSYHVFARRADGAWRFAYIDLHRASVKGAVSLFDAVRDLTGLHLTVPPGQATRTERYRFLIDYFGGPSGRAPVKRMAAKILKRSQRIATRRRFREIAEGKEPS